MPGAPMHDLSLGEVRALAFKAATGAGCAPGLAEEAGWATVWLIRSGLGGAEALAALLDSPDGPEVLAGLVARADAGWVGEPVQAPGVGGAMILPFLASTLDCGRAWRVETGPLRFDLWREGTTLGQPLPDGAGLVLHPCRMPDDRPSPETRAGRIDRAAWAILGALCDRTYAPASDASRLRGAGSGQSDND